jgi:hypothetical protein
MSIFDHLRSYLEQKHHHPDEHPCILIENLTINVGEEKPHPNPVRGIIFFLTSNKISFMALSFTGNNQLAIGTLGLQDVVTGLPVTPTSPFSGISVTSDTPAVATAIVDASNNIDATSVSAGAFNLTIVFTAVYNNSLGVSTTATITVLAPGTVAQATADQVAGTITWGTPTAIVTPAPTPTA